MLMINEHITLVTRIYRGCYTDLCAGVTPELTSHDMFGRLLVALSIENSGFEGTGRVVELLLSMSTCNHSHGWSVDQIFLNKE